MALPEWVSDVVKYAPTMTLGLGGLGLLGYQIIRGIIRRFSKDGLEVTKDRAEGDFVKQLMESNKTLIDANTALRTDADRLSRERAEALAKLGKLESDLDHIKKALSEAHTDVAILRRKLGISLELAGNNNV